MTATSVSATFVNKCCREIIKRLPKAIQTKIKNINKAGVCIICTTKRVCQTSRRICEYGHVVKCNHTIEQLSTHTNGVVIEVPYREYKRIKTVDALAVSHLDDYILNNIGGNSNNAVVAVISIRKENGYSGSSSHRTELEEFKKEIELRIWEPIYEINRTTMTTMTMTTMTTTTGTIKLGKNKGHLNWGGHYYYNVSGGSQESFKSHPTSEPQIFTTSKGFMSNSNVVGDVIISLVWQMLHCYDLSIHIPDEEDILKYKKVFEEYLKTKIYLGKSCFHHLTELENIHDGKLISPITREYISIHAFDCEKTLNKDDQANISHNEAVNKDKSYFCPDQNVILSDYRPGNLFWDTRLGNMQQQSYTIQEYWSEMEKRNTIRTAQLRSKQAK